MDPPDKEIPFQPRVKMGSQELDHIIQARKNLSDVTALAQYAILYKNLGWSPVALDAHTGSSLQVDFDQPQPTWLNLLMNLALKKTNVSLAIRLEPDSRLFVLMVNPAFGQEFLDSLGDWRSPCIARAGDTWENHFLVLPQTWCFSPGHDNDDDDAPLSVVGPGRVVAVPPSGNPSSQEAWIWLQHPGEQPPGHPSPGLLLLLEEGGYISRKSPHQSGICPPGKIFIPSSVTPASCCKPCWPLWRPVNSIIEPSLMRLCKPVSETLECFRACFGMPPMARCGMILKGSINFLIGLQRFRNFYRLGP